MPNQQLRDYTTAMANKMRDLRPNFERRRSMLNWQDSKYRPRWDSYSRSGLSRTKRQLELTKSTRINSRSSFGEMLMLCEPSFYCG